MIRYTENQITAFHRALHEACGLPAIRPSVSDQRVWWDFLQELAPLADDESGPFTETDILPVIRRMQWECREGKASWSLRPSHILRNPETFRDLVLMTRQQRRSKRPTTPRPASPPRETAPRDTPATAEVVSGEEIARMRRELNLPKE